MVLIDKIYEKCMSGPCRGELTAQNVSFYYSSPYSIYCEKFVSHNKKDPQSPYRELLQERGQKHEKRVIENRYPGYTPLVYKKPEEGFLELLKEMASGAEVICGLPVFFLPENMEGRIDILEKQTDQSSVFGSYYYVVKEIKLSKTIRKEHILQGAFYTYMIAHIQGLLPERLFIINRDHEEEGYIYKHYEEELEDAIRVTQAILDGSEIPTPTYNGCDWPWQTYCNHQALKNRDVSLVVHVGSKKKTQLVAHGFRKIWDISSAKVDELQKIPGIGQHTAQKLILSAQALTRTELILLDKKALKFPQTTNELFLDLEGTDQPGFKDELAQVDYLIGVLSRKNNKEEYKSFFAYRPEDEGSMLREFIKFLKAQKDYVIYHWHNYEYWHIKRM
ncbi:MAG: TM0106 family RecB-like putative nuclease, partial [Thermodesulfobacteriota bacterium]|nr:TM0106 family RecB-like putative nuclease [Thermodesulfobacteriota bacterium]